MNQWSQIRFDEQGLVPAVVQDWRDGTVLMVGFMNREALTHTAMTKHVHFWSRSRKKLWEKGETSGHFLLVKDLFVDCDGDTVLVKAEPVGPTCHTGSQSCFFSPIGEAETMDGVSSSGAIGGIFERISRTIADRKEHPKSGSYVSSLFEGGQDRILKKIAEETGEVMLGSKNDKREEIIHEMADLFFHALVVLGYHGIPVQDVYQELASRHGQSGLRADQKGTKKS